jgi:hypothetical protein
MFWGLLDVTLDDCANNPRKIERRKVKIHLKDIGYLGLVN